MGAKFDFGNAAQELKQVHAMMAMAYNDNNYAADVVRAKQMEAILRKLKHTNLAVENGNSNNLESIFDEQCREIVERSLRMMQTASGSDKLYAKRLFMTTHGAGYELGKNMNVDDIVEAELSAVIQSIQSLAFEGISVDGIDFLSHTTGRIKGNLVDDAQKIMENITEGIMSETINKIQNTNFKNKAYQKIAAKLKNTQSKSIKADVISYEVELSAQLKPEWELFNVFEGASFTIKNYIPKRKNNIAVQIHLGESNPYKSVMAQLGSLGYTTKQSQHIFFHSLNSWMKNKTQAVEVHIPHLRFAYELQGSGLYDEDGMSISGADFLIVNDPTNYDGIYVRSTKQMIANALKNNIQNPQPFTSMQYILYSDIINGTI